MHARLLGLLLLAAWCLTGILHAQTPALHAEAGRPFLTNFTPAAYDADTQNWAVVEDERGILYAGNNRGVLEYDGVSWRLLPLPNRSVVRSLARDADGRIWVGGTGELGYLAPDSLGRMAFVSLRDTVPEAHRAFADVWNTYATDEGVYFITAGAIFRWDGSTMQVWPAETSFHVSFVVDGVFYVRQWEVGLMRMERTAAGDSLRLAPGGARFAGTRVYVMLPYGEERMLIGTREAGLFLYDGERFESFKTEADELLARGQLYLPGSVLPGGRFALGTLTEGLVVIDRSGRLLEHIDRPAGLEDITIYHLYEARSGDLWLGLDKGLARVEIASPFTRYDAPTGGGETTMARHEGRLYASTSREVVYLDPTSRSFRPVRGPLNQVFALLSVAGDLLVAGSNEGVYRVVGERAEPVRASVSDDYDVTWLHRWSRDSNRVLVGLEDGLGVLRRSATGWIDEGRVPGVDVDAWYLAESMDGTLWLGTQTSRLVRVRLPEPQGSAALDLAAADVTVYGPEDGLVEGSLFPFRVGDAVYVTGLGETVFRFEEEAGRFVEALTFDGARSGHPLAQFILREDAEGRVWIAATYSAPVVAHPQDDGSYTFETLRPFRQERIIDIYPEADGVVWLKGGRVIRYDTKQEARPGGAFPPLIRRVAVGEDDLHYGGAGETPPPELAHGSGTLRFAYAAPGAAAAARYRTRLVGFDVDWSAWTTETEQAYTNLPPGDYTFRVETEARGEAAYPFAVLPPWYRTWGAYALYLVLFALGVFAVDRVQRRRLVKKERERAALREAELRAETMEAEAHALKAENQRKQNVELLSRIGQAITSTLSVKDVIETVYEHVNALMDAAVFGIGLYNEDEHRIDFPATKEKGETLPPFFNRLDDENRLAVWCFTNRQEVVSNDYGNEYHRYVKRLQNPVAGEHTESILYLPLVYQDKAIGVITAQSFEREAYTEHHVNVLRNLATYTAIALDNAEAYRRLHTTVERLNATLSDLQSTQARLVQSEKLASLGQLTAGIAHEIKNPLNFINNFAELNMELADELREEIEAGKNRRVAEVMTELGEILNGLKINARQIAKHGKRADRIVKSMMEHASADAKDRYRVEVNAFVEEYTNLAYQGKKTQVPDLAAVHIERDYDEQVGTVEMAPQEMSRVLLNLLGNALDAVHEYAVEAGAAYSPMVRVSTRLHDGRVEIRVTDNGPGIAAEIREKIFEPFFTTKPTGTGTGLGLSLSYDIVTQGHGGTLKLESTEGEGATFIITLPYEAIRAPETGDTRAQPD